MKLELFWAFFVSFVTTSESIWCFRCNSGNYTHDLYSNFPKTNCWISNNNSIVHHTICKKGCIKLEIYDNDRELNIYDCHDKYIDKKLNANAQIKNRTACFKNFCNGETNWNIPKSRNSNTKPSVSEFWIYICLIALVSLIIYIFRLICKCKSVKNCNNNDTNVNSRTRLIG